LVSGECGGSILKVMRFATVRRDWTKVANDVRIRAATGLVASADRATWNVELTARSAFE